METTEKMNGNFDDLLYSVTFDPNSKFPVTANLVFSSNPRYNDGDFYVSVKMDKASFLLGDTDLEVDISDMPAEIENFIRDKIEQIEKWGETELENYLDIDGIKDELNDWYQAERSERIERSRR